MPGSPGPVATPVLPPVFATAPPPVVTSASWLVWLPVVAGQPPSGPGVALSSPVGGGAAGSVGVVGIVGTSIEPSGIDGTDGNVGGIDGGGVAGVGSTEPPGSSGSVGVVSGGGVAPPAFGSGAGVAAC